MFAGCYIFVSVAALKNTLISYHPNYLNSKKKSKAIPVTGREGP
jgi:hypothetical protein